MSVSVITLVLAVTFGPPPVCVADALMCADITNYYDENSIHTAYYYSCKIASFIYIALAMYDVR